jgi:hypothetical protein
MTEGTPNTAAGDAQTRESVLNPLLSVPAMWRTENKVVVSGHKQHRQRPSPIFIRL